MSASQQKTSTVSCNRHHIPHPTQQLIKVKFMK
jgi:hypothetical protein